VSSNNGTVYNVYRDDNLTTQHKIRVTSLIPGTPYYYTVSSTDEFGNGPTLSAEKQFTTNDTIDVDSPMVIEPLKVVGITHKSAVIHWRTDEPADSVIEFGSSAATLSRIESDTKLKQKHVLHLVDLAADTEYFFRANSTDSSGNKVATDISSFRTRTHPDTAKPAFPVSPSVIGQTDTTATIYWETDKPSECVVEYGVGQSKTNRRSLSGKSTKHQVTLAGLLPNETYSFVVSSTDASGNRSEHSSVAQVAQVETSRNKGMFATVVDWFVEQAIAEGDVATGFSTNAIPDTTAPSITIEPEVVSSASEYIVLRWVTDEPAYSRAEFNLYGGTLGRVIGDINYNTEHLMVLPNLTSNTAYDVQVFSVDAAGNEVASSIQTVVSGAQADVQEPVFTIAPAVNVVSDTEVIAIWGTDEYTISELECVSTGTTSTWQVSVEGLRKHHTLHLNGLEAGPEYECQVSSQDISGNKVNSGIATVRTAVQSTNPAGSGVDNNPNPSVDLVSTTTTEPNVAPSVSGGGSLNPLYLLFMTAYFVAFSRYRRKY
jgi:chitodextrinase